MNRRISRRWGWKLLFVFSTAFFMIGVVLSSSDFKQELNAAVSTAPTFQMYDKVKLANKEFTIIGTGENIKLLADSDTGNEVTWTEANSTISNMHSNMGAIGKEVFKQKFKLPTQSELSHLEIEKSYPNLESSLNRWWLGDESENNRSKFVSKENRLDGINVLPKTIISTTNTCAIENQNEIGVLPTYADIKDSSVNASIFKSGRVDYNYSLSPSTATLSVQWYSDSHCTNPVYSGGISTSPILYFNANGTVDVSKLTNTSLGSLAFDYADKPLKYKIGDKMSYTIEPGICYYTTGVSANIANKGGKYIKLRNQSSSNPAQKFTVTLTAKSQSGGSTTTLNCNGQSHPAGTAAVRSLVTLPMDNIMFAINEKRVYEISSHFTNSFPESNGTEYLTLKTDAIDVELDSSAYGVNGNTYSIPLPKDHIVEIPVAISGIVEGNTYVSATADINGIKRYAVLNKLDNTQGKVSIDLSDFSDTPEDLKQINLTIYQENEGEHDVSYISTGKEITILFEEDVVDEIPEGWVMVSPDAKVNGWNKEAVTISLSEEAKNAGYTTIEVVNDANVVQKSGTTITYDSETDGIIPKARLKKGDAYTNPSSLRTIKIDTTKPSASVSIEKEAEWAVKKKVTINASDTGSGIDTVVIQDPDGGNHTLSLSDGTYVHEATKEGTYTITVTDFAGNTTTLSEEIIKIDTTTISLTAEKEELKTDQPKQKITLTYQEGSSGIDTFKVYYKQSGSDYTYLENITVSASPMDWYAEMNGWFKFELVNKAGEKAEAEVEITQVNPPKPVTKIHAVHQDDSTINYKSDTWTNHNIVITLSNANEEITDEVLFEYSEDNGVTWKSVTDDTLTISTDTTKEITLQFRSKVSDTVKEETSKSFIVKIDKTKPVAPIIVEKEKYTRDTWYSENVIVETQITPKEKLSQEVYACAGTKEVCSSDNGSWTKVAQGKKEFSENGSYEVYFKVIDEAGNESDLSEAAYVNINNTKPIITISLKKNPIKSLIHDLTFGFFYKDTVDIDIDVDFQGEGQSGHIYYIVDTEEKEKPADDSADWIEGTHTTLIPQGKAMIYAKAVSDAGVSAREDSIYHVYADSEAPTITLPADMETWSKDSSIDISIEDTLSGIDLETVKIQIDTENEQILTLKNGKAKLDNLKNGEYSILVKASDYSENEASQTVKVKIDAELPQIGEPSADVDGWAEQKDISFTAVDACSGVASVVVKDSTGNELEITDVTKDTYQFTVHKNGAYTITVTDHAGNVSVKTYNAENIKGDQVQDIQVIATNKGQQINSETWVNGEILFTISGGLDVDTLEKYQYAVTDGEQPSEDNWQDLNQSDTHQHTVTGNVNGKSYWFRVVPTNLGVEISKPFVVNLDNEAPYDVTVHTEKINDNFIARAIHVMSLGAWMKEAQSVSVDAKDNFTPVESIRYEYAEEIDGEMGQWQTYPASLTYEDTAITLYVRAIDLAGNMSEPIPQSLQIDTTPPVIAGVKDQDVYKKYYYVYRTITYTDDGSDIDDASAIIKKDGVSSPLSQEYKVKDFGSYEVSVKDNAGNETVVRFQLVPLPDIDTEIDGTDESKDIIDQVKEELEEERNNLAPDEIKDYEKWIEDATKKWESERKKKLEDKETGTIIEGEGDTSFDPNTVLVVDEIDESKVPNLPRRAINVYDVYMKKGDTVIQPDGSVKVYLPYMEKETPIVYEIDENGNVKEIKGTVENGFVTFVTDTLKKYAISNEAQNENKKDVCVVGPDKDLDTKDDVCGSEDSTKNPDGSVDVSDDGKVIFPDKEIDAPDGAHINPDGSVDFPDGSHYDPDGNLKPKDEENNTCTAGPDGKLGTSDDVCGEGNGSDDPKKNEDGSVDVPDGGTIHFPDKEIDVPDGAHIHPDGSVELPDGTEYDKDGNIIPDKDSCPLDGKKINIDTDKDGLPDINLDIYGANQKGKPDCKADLNIDINNDKIPDLNIDTTGDGKPNINIDTDEDGYADLNILLNLKKWTPDFNTNVNGFAYDTMVGLQPDMNVDEDGDGKPDRNIDTDGDGLPERNVDADWFSKHGMKDPKNTSMQESSDTAMGGALTGDSNKWAIWWILFILTCTTMVISYFHNKKGKYKSPNN